MGSLEVYFGTIAFIITLIGLARGYSRELGSTMIILVVIFLLLLTEQQLNPLLARIGETVFGADLNEPLFLSLLYQAVFVAAVFTGYAGHTITFSGRELPPPQGVFLTILIGILNGYLIAGSLWHYQQAYSYPFQELGLVDPNLSATAETMVRLLPQVIMPSAALWMIPIAFLLLLRVRG